MGSATDKETLVAAGLALALTAEWPPEAALFRALANRLISVMPS
jgi:hypothetical protein